MILPALAKPQLRGPEGGPQRCLPSRCKLLEPARLKGAKLAVSRNGRRRRSAEARDWQTWTLAAEAEIGPQAHMVGGPQ
jgi:hypothetical protein